MSDWTIEQIMEGLDPLLEDLDQIVRSGFSTYRKYDPLHLIEHTPSASALNIYCHMVAEAERRFVGRAGVIPLNVPGLKTWAVGQRAVIRFKKMDEDGHTRNYPTKQAKDFDFGKDIIGLPPKAARMSIGYLQNAAATEVKRVQIARPHGKRVEWCVAVFEGDHRWQDVTKQRKFAA
jgi:hypothetical protein